ncbi:MAG: DUF2071 domain-containing protein [Phycisphaeraceae bacterium]
MTHTLIQPSPVIVRRTGALSDAARAMLESTEGGPTFISDWHRALIVHYEVEPEALGPLVPFALDLRGGRAYVSLVMFTLRRMRPRIGGKITEWLSCPFANQRFLNVRTYVTHDGEPGIFFLGEWLSSRLSAFIGPRTFGLPCKVGRLELRHDIEAGDLHGHVSGVDRRTKREDHLRYQAAIEPAARCEVSGEDSLAEFLLERYAAFTERGGVRRRFRIWHEPWPMTPVNVTVDDDSLLAQTGPWLDAAQLVGAHYSPGVSDVWFGKPLCINGAHCGRSILPARKEP